MTARKDKTNSAEKTTDQADTNLTYEEARDQLMEVVSRLESGGESLSESMSLFTQGEKLATLCETYLTDARKTVETALSESSPATT